MPDVAEPLARAVAAPAGAAAEPAQRGSAPGRRLRRASDYGVIALAGLILAVAAATVQGFGTLANFETIMRDASFVGIVALGMTFVVMSGNYVDLSVAAQVGIAAICAIALQPQGQLFALVCGLAACALVGLVNGVVVGYMRANAVVVTLGVGTVALALLTEVTDGAQYAGQVGWFGDLTGVSLGPLPISFLLFLAIAIVSYLMLDRMGFGRRLRAVGSNAAAAEIAGVARGRIVLGAFLFTAVCCALAGFLVAGFANSANPGLAADYTFEALAAVIVGGNSLTGGRGGAGRTVIGVLLIAIIANLLVVAGLSFEWQQFVKGIVIVAAVAFDASMRKAGAR